MEFLIFSDVSLFVLGSFYWWILAASAFGLSLWTIERDNGIALSVVFVGFFSLCALAGDFNIITWAIANPSTAGIVLGLYLLCGSGWALFKFSLFAADQKDEFDDMIEAWLAGKGIEGKKVPEDLKQEFSEYLMKSNKWSYHVGHKEVTDDNGKVTHKEEVRKIRPYPIWRENKRRAVKWAAAWPLSMCVTFFSDFFRIVFRRIMNMMGSLADAISIRRFAGTEENYTITPKKEKEKEEKK
ncbi:MAG: hypothetical protein ACW99G_19695 [Candidatus Thorarchaeota archaeon]|jgi:hypothetical protein